MKKLFIITSVVGSLVASSAFAKTEGSYAGVDLLNTKATFKEVYHTNTVAANTASLSTTNSGYGIGVNYKYAVNFNGFYLAPGVFAEHNNLRVKSSSKQEDVKYRYGVRTDLGYDVTDEMSVYGVVGYNMVNYQTRNADLSSVYGNKHGVRGDWMYGAGVKHDLNKTTTVSLEYNTENLKLKTNTGGTSGYSAKFNSRVDVLKVGLAFRF